MTQDITIQPFSPEHGDQVFDLILPIQIEEFGIAITRQDQPDLARIPEFYQKYNGNFWIAIAKNTVVGTISLLDIGDQQVALRKMFVRADYRGNENGVAQKLLNTSTSWAKEHAVTNIFLGTTSKFKAAHRFHEKNGFTEINKENLPPGFPVISVDTKFYHYRLG